jgi:hypothetical protein
VVDEASPYGGTLRFERERVRKEFGNRRTREVPLRVSHENLELWRMLV